MAFMIVQNQSGQAGELLDVSVGLQHAQPPGMLSARLCTQEQMTVLITSRNRLKACRGKTHRIVCILHFPAVHMPEDVELDMGGVILSELQLVGQLILLLHDVQPFRNLGKLLELLPRLRHPSKCQWPLELSMRAASCWVISSFQKQRSSCLDQSC